MAARRVKEAGPITKIFFGLLFIVFGYFLSFNYAASRIEVAENSINWPSVEGKILSSEVSSRKGSGTKRSRGSGKTYSPDVVYSYTVEGKSYQNSDIDAGDIGPGGWSTSNHSRVQEIVDKYPEGSKLSVYYNPSSPKVSLLDTSMPSSMIWFYRGGIVTILLGVWLLVSVIGKILFVLAT